MVKIDVSKIEGYADMTPEEKVAILEGYEYEDNSSELERYKNAVSKANSEVAEWKKKHNALLSEDEQKRTANEEELNLLRTQVKELREKETIASYKSEFLALGCEDKLATEMATSLVGNDMNKVFGALKKHLETVEKNLRNEILKDTPPPVGGNTDTTITMEQFRKMSVSEQYKFSVEHPDEYKKLYGGN